MRDISVDSTSTMSLEYACPMGGVCTVISQCVDVSSVLARNSIQPKQEGRSLSRRGLFKGSIYSHLIPILYSGNSSVQYAPTDTYRVVHIVSCSALQAPCLTPMLPDTCRSLIHNHAEERYKLIDTNTIEHN
jgi:hypothetical protein